MGEFTLEALNLSSAFGGCAIRLGRARLRRLNVATSRAELGLELLCSRSMPCGFGRRDVNEGLEIAGGSGLLRERFDPGRQAG